MKKMMENFAKEDVKLSDVTPVHVIRRRFGEVESLPLLGFGGVHLPIKPGLRNVFNDAMDFTAAEPLVHYAIAHGVNYFDSGYFYHNGDTDRLYAHTLTKYPRESYYLANKMPVYHVKTREDAKKIFAEQLQRCQTEYFDFYFLHNVSKEEQWDDVAIGGGVLDYLKELRKEGVIRHLGFSFHGRTDLFRRIIAESCWEMTLILLNALDWNGPNLSSQLLAMATEKGIPVFVMEPLAGGRLAKLNARARAILSKYAPDKTPANWAFRFAASKPNVAMVLSGSSRMEHLRENVQTFSAEFKPFTLEEEGVYERAITAELGDGKTVPCSGCKYCMPCPFGVNIQGVFEWWNDYLREHGLPSCEPGDEEARWRFLRNYENAFPGRTSAFYCTGCKRCEKACPQWQFVIPDELDRIDAAVSSIRDATPDYNRDDLFFRAKSALKARGIL